MGDPKYAYKSAFPIHESFLSGDILKLCGAYLEIMLLENILICPISYMA